jgi:polar amino acid transport system substrate-binding protein
MRRILVSALLLVLACAACGLPRDAKGTLDRVRGGRMRVGVVVDTPWVTDSAGAVGGVEAALVGEVARGLHATPQWVPGTESKLMESLKSGQLDLVIGGLDAKTPWSKEVGLTKPFYTDSIVVGASPGTAQPATLKHARVYVASGDPAGGYVEKKGAVPVYVGDLERAGPGLVAAPSWRLGQIHRAPTGIQLHTQPHVMAAAPGENAWLLHVDTVLQARMDRVPGLLRGAKP